MAMDQAQTFEWMRHRIYEELEPLVKELESANARLREALTGLDNLWSSRVQFSGGVTNPSFEGKMNSRFRSALTVPPAKDKS